MASSQKFIARNRAPRVQIEYEVELYGAQKKVDLPFVMGVLADLSGKPAEALPSVADRKFLEIDIDSFDERMKAMRPRVAFTVPNTVTGEGNLSVDLTFESMEDFTPGAIAARVDGLRDLLQARRELADLLVYMDGKTGAEALVERILSSRGTLAAIASGTLPDTPADETAAALAALRAAAPAEAPAPDTSTAAALAALRAAAPAEAVEQDQTAGTLAALRATAPVEAVAPDQTAEALAALRAAAPAETAEQDQTTDTLAALKAAAPALTQTPDQIDDALSALRGVTPAQVEAPDQTADALAALRAAAPLHDEAPDTAAEALAALRAAAPIETVEQDQTTDTLAALKIATPVAAEAPDTAAGALAALRAAAPAETAEQDQTTDTLAALKATAPVAAEAPDRTADALAALRATTPVHDEAADIAADTLAALRAATPIETVEQDQTTNTLAALKVAAPALTEAPGNTADALAALRAVTPAQVEAPDAAAEALASLRQAAVGAAGDPLAGLDDLLAETPGEGEPSAGAVAEDDPLAGLGALLAAPEPEALAEDDPLAGLDVSFGEPAAGEALAGDDPLAGLDALLEAGEVEEAPAEDDPLAGLDALLAEPEAGPEIPAEDDPLAGLDALLGEPAGPADGEPEPGAPAEDDPLAGLDALLAEPEAGPEIPAEDDPLAGLDALLGEPEAAAEDGPAEEDPLAALTALLAVPEDEAAGPDPLAGLDDLLAGDPPEGARAEDLLAGLDDLLAPQAATPARKETAMTRTVRPMDYGTLTASDPAPGSLDRRVFRMAILGDFSGRAANARVETGDRLARRRAIRLDIDSVEEVIEGFATTLVLPIGQDGQGIEVELGGLDDLHPDELVEKVELFEELKGLRRRLANPSTAARAVAEMRGWGQEFTAATQPTRSRSGAGSVPADRRLSDFQTLIGDAQGRLTQPSPAADLIARVVGPHVVPGPNPEARALVGTVDGAMGAAMRLVLHHPEFQAIEAAWRTLDMIARQIETDEKLEITIFDISAEEFAADLGAPGDLAKTGIFQLLNEPLTVEGGTGFSAVFGLYTFEETPPHAELLGRMGRIAAHLRAPFVAGIGAGFMDVAKRDRHPLVAQAWDGLRGDPAAAWLGLAAPRFLLRRPYGRKGDPIDAFAFEEFTMAEGLSGMLWANPTALVAILLAKTWTEGRGRTMDLGRIMSITGMPYHIVNDAHGDQIALPCTERNVTTEKTETIVTRGLMPVISVRGRDVVRLGSFQSLAGQELAGRWGEMPAGPAPTPGRAPQMEVPIPPADSVEDDLDALLKGFGDTPAPADPGAIDADLAALLEGL